MVSAEEAKVLLMSFPRRNQHLRMANMTCSIPTREEQIRQYESSLCPPEPRPKVEDRMARSFANKGYQRSHYVRQKWDPRREAGGEVSLTMDLARSIEKYGIAYRVESSRAVISEKDFMFLKPLMDPKYDYLQYTTILRLSEWLAFVAKHNLGSTGEGTGEVPRLSTEALRELGEIAGMPMVAFSLKVGAGDLLGRMDRPVLYRAYSEVLRLYPYDLEAQATLVGHLNEAYDYAIANLANNANLKVDYDLVVLRNYQTLSRIQTSPELSSAGVPRYWFDPADLAEGAPRPDRSGTGVEFDVAGAMGALAIEESWSPSTKTRYLVEAGFPAGSVFLRTTVEAQATTPGGGIEYIYLPGRGEGKVAVVSATRV